MSARFSGNTVAALGAIFTKVCSNGSGDVQPIETLLARLESDTLDPTFEDYGNFILDDMWTAVLVGYDANGKAMYERGERIYPEHDDVVQFWGNFATYSHVFQIETNDPKLIERLTAAIRKNQETPAYLAAKAQEAERRKLVRANQKRRVA